MGQKRQKFGRTTGATLRRHRGAFFYNYHDSEVGLIQKQVEYNNNVIEYAEKEEILTEFEEQFEDGGLEVGNRPGRDHTIPYSLNKHKRWQLPNLLKENIKFDSSHETNKFEVVLVENSVGYFGKYRTDCIGIHKSKGEIHSKTPRKRYALARNLLEAEENAKVSNAKRNSGNRKKRTINQVEEVEMPKPLPRLKYEISYERSRDQFPNFKTRDYNRHCRDIGKVEVRDTCKKTQNTFFNSEKMAAEDAPEYCDHFDTDDGYLGDEESMIYVRDSESQAPSLGDFINILKKPTKSQKSVKLKKDLKCEERKNTRKDRKYFITPPATPTTTTNTEAHAPDEVVTNTVANSVPTISPTRSILIQKPCTTSENLTQSFGNDYIEGASTPRKFIIDVTSHLLEILKERRMEKSCKEIKKMGKRIFVIFSNDTEGFTNYSWAENEESSIEEVEEFRVRLFGLNTTADELLMSNLLQKDNRSFSVTDIIAVVKEIMKQLPENLIYTDVKTLNNPLSHLSFKSLQTHLQQVSEVISPNDLYQRHAKTVPPKITTEIVQQPDTCGICYADLLPSNGGVSASALNSCQHWFCEECWRCHIRTRIGRGDCTILCPEYKCDVIVATPTLMSFTTTEQFQNHTTHKEIRMVESDPTWIWCPEPNCGYVGRVQLSRDMEQGFVPCECGKSWCLECKGDVHWPALCKQAHEYVRTIKKMESDKREHRISSVQVKRCPHCKRAMEKNGGCPNMVCVCGKSFCWVCLRPHYYSPSCNQAAKTHEVVELYPVALGVTKDEILTKATDFRKLSTKSIFTKIERGVIRLLTKMHTKEIRQNSDKPTIAIKSTSTSGEMRTCSWCSNEEHDKIHKEVVTIAQEMAEFYTETYHLLEWTFVFLAFIPTNKILRAVSNNVAQLIFILEMTDEIITKQRGTSEMETKTKFKKMLQNGKKCRRLLYETISCKRKEEQLLNSESIKTKQWKTKTV
ncbi:uncharacterized protein [Antedon mediterranea]|uniref:uncharacterized protein n=1 Tax=Antedon mediterranea TaxID=105859 RepID=UPI003AF9546C